MFDFCFFSLVIELDEIIAGFIAGIYRNYSRFVDDENDCTVLTYHNSATYESVRKSRYTNILKTSNLLLKTW